MKKLFIILLTIGGLMVITSCGYIQKCKLDYKNVNYNLSSTMEVLVTSEQNDKIAKKENVVFKQGKEIYRLIELTFSDANHNNPDDEKFVLTGHYKEDIIGLLKNTISIAGSFNIQLVSDVDTLNDQ
jgi:hypothetical protein